MEYQKKRQLSTPFISIRNKINIQKNIYIPFELYPFCSILVISILFEILLGRNISKVSKQKIEGSFKKMAARIKFSHFVFPSIFFDLFLTFLLPRCVIYCCLLYMLYIVCIKIRILN